MERDDRADIVGWANLAPASAMALVWLAPMVLFWGMVFGPLRPVHARRVNLTPSMPIFFLCCGASLLPRALPRSYFHDHNVERSRRLYERLGVRIFKKFVLNGDAVNRWARRHNPCYRVVPRRADLDYFAEQTRSVEQSHLVLFTITLFSAFYAARIGWHGWAICLTIGNVVCNIYPVLLQRYNRARITLIDDGRRNIGALGNDGASRCRR